MAKKKARRTSDSNEAIKKRLPLRTTERTRTETHEVKYTEISHQFDVFQILSAIKAQYQGVPDDAQIEFHYPEDDDYISDPEYDDEYDESDREPDGVKVWWERDKEIVEP